MNVSHELMLEVVGKMDLAEFFGHTHLSPLQYAFHWVVNQTDAECTITEITPNFVTIAVSQKVDFHRHEVLRIKMAVGTPDETKVFVAFIEAALQTMNLVSESQYEHHLKGHVWSEKFEMWVAEA